MNIIVVDDETAALHLYLEEFLQEGGTLTYRFFHDDEGQILSFAKNNEIDGAFLDIRMPRIDGFALAEKLIRLQPKIKIVFVTGFNLTLEDLSPTLQANVLGVAYKPIKRMVLDQYLELMMHGKNVLTVQMFGSFDCFIHGRLVHFSSSKSKELFAFLLANNGKSVTMEQAITALWPDKDVDKAKILYRDAVWRLRSTLTEINCPCVGFARALLTLDKTNIQCDYYDFLSGKDIYSGEFLTSYEWSLPYEGEIEYILAQRH